MDLKDLINVIPEWMQTIQQLPDSEKVRPSFIASLLNGRIPVARSKEEGAEQLEIEAGLMMDIVIQMVMTDASLYCKHAGRNVVSSIDLLYALKRPHFSERIFQEMAEYEIYDEEEDEDEEEDSEEEPDGLEGILVPEHLEWDQVWTPSTCSCTVCVAINEGRDTWQDWQPQSFFDKAIKSGVDLLRNRLRTVLDTELVFNRSRQMPPL
jgi:hypothetical protein